MRCNGIEVHLDHYHQMSWLLICSRKNSKFIKSVAFNPICVCELPPNSTSLASVTQPAPSWGQGHPSSVPVGRSRQRIHRRGNFAWLFNMLASLHDVKYQGSVSHQTQPKLGGRWGLNLPLWQLTVFRAPAWSKVRDSFS